MAAEQQNPFAEKKTSFLGSVVSGMTGYVKGAIGGGLLGAVGGALVGAVIAGITLATGGTAGLAAGAAAVGLSALSGVGTGALIAAPLGALAGLVTGVVRSRERSQPSASDIVNVAKVSFAQGVQVGHQIEHAKHHGQGKFAQAYLDEKNKPVMAEQQVRH